MNASKRVFFFSLFLSIGIAAAATAQTATNGDEIIFRIFDDGAGDTSYVIHRYLATGGDGTFTAPSGVASVDYLVVGGGGAGGMSQYRRTGGGGAGGMVDGVYNLADPSYTVVVGAGGASSTSNGNGANGVNSSVFGVIGLGGGGGGNVNTNGVAGGSGGGAGGQTDSNKSGGAGQQPGSASGGYGNAGGSTFGNTEGPGGAGGGGAGGPGQNVDNIRDGGDGGIGRVSNIDGLGSYYAGGGGGLKRVEGTTDGEGGLGGGGDGGDTAEDGDTNTGGGGGGGGVTGSSGEGGSGIVAIRYENAWTGGSQYYDLNDAGRAKNLRIEDAVNVRIAAGEDFDILADGLASVGHANGGVNARLIVNGTLTLGTDAALTVQEDGVIGGSGTVAGDLTLSNGAGLVFSSTETLTVNGGTVDLGNLSVDRLIGLTHEFVEIGQTYTLIDGTATFLFGSVQNKSDDPYDLGNGKLAYFDEGSLQLVVIPEPHTLGLLLAAGALLALRRRR